MNLQDNIKSCRKAMGFTQEQLAEAMGVTVGAVSKWESGQSLPDLNTLMDLAELFQTSTDALLGFALRGEGAEEQAAAIKACMGERAFERGRVKAEKALQNFPNHFGVVYRSAVFYEMMGLDTGDKEAFRKAIGLYGRACGLLEQNTDGEIGLRTLYSHISQCHHCLGEYDKALEILKAHNEGGVYDDLLGLTLLKLDRWEEAIRVSSECMMESLTRLERAAMVLWNGLSEGRGEHREARALQEWTARLYESLYPDGSCYLHKMNAAIYAGCAILSVKLAEEEAAKAYLRRAKAAAQCFDADPSYEAGNMRFYHGRSATAHDDFGTTAMDGILQTLLQQEEPERARVLALWERVQAE